MIGGRVHVLVINCNPWNTFIRQDTCQFTKLKQTYLITCGVPSYIIISNIERNSDYINING